MPDTPYKFYLTTPIYYVNARPHIGHAYSTIAADVIARRHRLLGDDTFFLTGTDEHGQKVQRSAEAAGIPPQQFADQVSKSFSDLWARMGITNDDYIRTTDERHKRGVQHLWRVLEARGAIYLSSYTGQYCVSEEMFVEGPPGTIGPDGKPTETVTEENYFFRLSDFQQPILDLIESGQLHIQPETVRNEVLSFVRSGLKDLSISRTTFDWGIPVPSTEAVIPSGAKNPRISPEPPPNPSEKHVIYVWLDALANYMTAVGYGSDSPADQAKFARYWPADLHLVGKEITRFHCVYWPAFLLALNPKLQHGPTESMPQLTPAEHAEWAAKWVPKSVVANGWLLFEESKMSKSRGNVVRTETILDAFGPLCPPVPVTADANSKAADEVGASPSAVILSEAKNPRISPQLPQLLVTPTKAQQDLFAADVLRYFLLREIPFGQDGSFSFDALITRYNADLANGYGNLVSRTLKMISNYFGGIVPEASFEDSEMFAFLSNVQSTLAWREDFQEPLRQDIEGYRFDKYLQRIGDFISATDQVISTAAPWKERDTEDETTRNRTLCLHYAWQMIRIITALLYPVIPYAAASVWAQLGLDPMQLTTNNQQLATVSWGSLKPGTKLGPLAPIFPRADKGLAQIMNDMESANTPAAKTQPKAAEPVLADDFSDIKPAEPAPSTTDPAAAPRTSNLPTSPESTKTEPATTSSPTGNLQPATGDSQTISIDDFAKIDLRVAQIVVAERIPKADKLLRLEVDLGSERRQILSGIAEFYTPEELIGKRIAIIANLAPRKMRGLESHGMLLAASSDSDAHSSKPILATFSDEIALGSKIR